MFHDASGKHMLSFTVVITDLLRDFVNQPWLAHVDLSTIEPVRTEYTNDKFNVRLNDMVWRIRKRTGEPLYVVVMMELQSSVEHFMAARMNMYVGLLFDTLVRSGQVKGRKLPHVVPLVLYTGERDWNAPLELTELIEDTLPGIERYTNQFNYHVVSVHQCRELDPARRNVADAWFRAIRVRDYPAANAALEQLIDVLEGPEHASLRAAITKWFLRVVLAVFLPEGELEQMRKLRDLVEVRQMLSENMVKWSEEWLTKGEARGLAKGLAQGQRSLLVRLARARFGSGTAAEFSDHLERINSPETLGTIGEWLLTCASSEALLAKLRQA